MSLIRIRYPLAIGIGGVGITFILLLSLLLRSAYRADAQAPASVDGPFVGVPTAPASIDVTRLPHDGGLKRANKHFLHPRGRKSLDQEKAETQQLGLGIGIEAPSSVTPSPLASSLGIGFDGISFEESFCNCYPSDGSVAAGPNHLVGVVNTAFKVWDKSGLLLEGPISLPAFFGADPSCLPNVSDPSASYDSAADHFVLEALTYDNRDNSSICIAVTQTGDPEGIWYVYAFPVTPSQNLLDFPHIAIGSDAIYLAGNQFQNGVSFSGARVYAYDKGKMYSGAAAGFVFYNVGLNAAGHLADSLYPA